MNTWGLKDDKNKIREKDSICPLCRSKGGRVLWRASSEEVAQFQMPKKQNSLGHQKLLNEIEKIWGRKECRIVKCPVCTLGYSDPNFGGSMKYYSLVYDDCQYPLWKWDYTVALDKVKNISKNKKMRCLEIGAGRGAFAIPLSKIVGNENVLCLEYSKNSIEELKKHGIRCLQKSILELQVKEKFTTVFIFQVLEHLEKVDLVIKNIRGLLGKNGDLFISVPDEDMIDFSEKYMKFRDYSPTHVTRWNKKAFDYLAEDNGFKIIEYKRLPQSAISYYKDFILGSITVNSIRSGSLGSLAVSSKSKILRRLYKLPLVVRYIIKAIVCRPKILYKSQWIHLRKV